MAFELDRAYIQARIPKRPDDSHKGTYGHLMILAGSRGFTGAAKLSSWSAERSGAGLVSLAVPAPLQALVAADLADTMTLGLPSTTDECFAEAAVQPALDAASKRSAVALGPGLGMQPETRAFVGAFTAQCEQPMIIDADALNALAEDRSPLDDAAGPRVLTPHPGEMSRLAKRSTQEVQANREAVALELANQGNAVVVLKGHRTVIASPTGEAAVNPTGHAGMAKGGTGDVLTGLLGGLLAQGLAPFDAACVAVYVHGLAGEFAAAEFTGRGMTASDLIACIPDAWRDLEA